MCSPMLKDKEKNHCPCLIETKFLNLQTILPNTKKKILIKSSKNLAV